MTHTTSTSLGQVKTKIEEELALAEGSSTYEILFQGGGGMHSKGDMNLVEVFLASLADLAVTKAGTIAEKLSLALLEGGRLSVTKVGASSVVS